MHPNGQIPAYEWALGDVNPPVHAWAALRVYQIERRVRGRADRPFLEKVFHKLLLNFTWWVNRKDAGGKNVFQGGFLGLDNIGVFDRSAPLPTGGHLEQSDGTSWMAMYHPDFRDHVEDARQPGGGVRRLLSIVSPAQLPRVLRFMLDEHEFLSPHGVRALSRVHAEQPYTLVVDGTEHRVDYEPAESASDLFGGNSNWRGPVWFPVNYLLIEALQRFHHSPDGVDGARGQAAAAERRVTAHPARAAPCPARSSSPSVTTRRIDPPAHAVRSAESAWRGRAARARQLDRAARPPGSARLPRTLQPLRSHLDELQVLVAGGAARLEPHGEPAGVRAQAADHGHADALPAHGGREHARQPGPSPSEDLPGADIDAGVPDLALLRDDQRERRPAPRAGPRAAQIGHGAGRRGRGRRRLAPGERGEQHDEGDAEGGPEDHDRAV